MGMRLGKGAAFAAMLAAVTAVLFQNCGQDLRVPSDTSNSSIAPATSSDPNSSSNPSPSPSPSAAPAAIYSYNWVTSSFGACSLACGGGSQQRSVLCVRNDGTAVLDSFCTQVKPAVTQTCNPQSCTNTNCQSAFSNQFFSALTATQGRVPFTVTFNIYDMSPVALDHIAFGDGTTVRLSTLNFVTRIQNNVGGGFACVNHTYTKAGTYQAAPGLSGSFQQTGLTIQVSP